jgi:hypothetical protein
MDPWLEHPALWPDFHNRLIAAIADHLGPILAPNYYIRLERRAYLFTPNDLEFIGRPDLSVMPLQIPTPRPNLPLAEMDVIEVEALIQDEVGESYLEVHDTKTRNVITVVEVLSPANKLHPEGRRDYEKKRKYILSSLTHLVEIDLLRAGDPMPVNKQVRSDYRILVMRGDARPRGKLYAFSVRKPIPPFLLPLLPGDDEPTVDLNTILHALYDRARFDLGLDYDQPPVPPLSAEDTAWARQLIKNAQR